MSQKPSCFVCGSEENVVCTFPQNQESFDKWIKILNITVPIKPSDRKMLCILHFEEKWHAMLLDKNERRSRYCIPISSDNSSKRSLSPPESFSQSDSTLHDVNKKETNYELLLKKKNDEIENLTERLKLVEIENKNLKESSEISRDLPENVKIMIATLSTKLGSGKRYTKAEKQLFQSLYYRDPGYYNFLRASLHSGLPSKTTLLKWQPIRTLVPGLVREVMSHLKHSSLTDEDRKVIVIFDEMDGRRGLHYESGSDSIVGFECLTKKTNQLAKKFLTVMIRGLNGTLGNIVIANFATASGITGKVFYFVSLFCQI